MTNLDPRPKEGGELGIVREAFPGVYFAENPTHPLHHLEGRLHSSDLQASAIALGHRPKEGSLGYNKAFLTLRYIASLNNEFPKKGDHGESLPWQFTLDITPANPRRMHHALIASQALKQAYEWHLEGHHATPARTPSYHEVIEHVLQQEALRESRVLVAR